VIRSLRDAQEWHRSARTLARLIQRLVAQHLNDESRDKTLGETIFRDKEFGAADAGISLPKMVETVLDELDDLVILLYFSVFEADVRERALQELQNQSLPKHPILTKVFQSAKDEIESGSFKRLTDAYGQDVPELRTQVDQVREYRNWVAHGRNGAPKNNVKPGDALLRLKQFMTLLDPPPPVDS